MKHSILHRTKFVVIGGGTGSFTVLSGLKHYVSDITALVCMADNGGSTGVLRDEYGVLPPGDVRQCLVALSEAPQLRELFEYRFEEGTFSGHSFGNIFLSTLEKVTGSFSESVEIASKILRIQGTVLPITTEDIHLMLENADGSMTKGEFAIAHQSFEGNMRPQLHFDAPAHITTPAKQAILDADRVVIAPGNLYGSLAPALIVDGVREALSSTKAEVIYVCNLVTKPHQTDGFKVHDYVSEIERFIGAPIIDYVIFNTDEPTSGLLSKYTHEGEFIVQFDQDYMARQHYHAIGLPLIASEPVAVKTGDKIAQERALIRHDTDILARQLIEL